MPTTGNWPGGISPPSMIFNGFKTDDILRVRLRTLGVIEHNFSVVTGGKTYNWRLFDVGGAVSLRFIPSSAQNDLVFESNHSFFSCVAGPGKPTESSRSEQR